MKKLQDIPTGNEAPPKAYYKLSDNDREYTHGLLDVPSGTFFDFGYAEHAEEWERYGFEEEGLVIVEL